ncbi:MAG TPA: HPF/RaiA family ribosome-associated protein [Gemmatimonadaceae bacterium]|nr:HPF/RaiA family ribosome-associated protein [Gemmatimonadaceae bacterium]
MEIVFHGHHAHIGAFFRRRAERGVQKLSRRLGSVTGAIVRVSNDADVKRVEVEIDAPGRRLVGKSQGKFVGPALTRALEAVARQVGHTKGVRQALTRREAMTRRVQEA